MPVPPPSRVQCVATMSPTPLLLGGDYRHAVVHLAWDREGQHRTLLFGCVELLPSEVPPPADDYDDRKSGVRLPGRGRYVYVRHVVTTAEAAVRWYEGCRHGVVRRPASDGSFDDPTLLFASGPLEEEPPWPGLVCHEEPSFPFRARWHTSARLHHLVAPDEPVLEWTPGEGKAALAYLEEQLFFSFERYRELLGSVHLIAPNPILRDVHLSRKESRGETEALRVEFVPRAYASLDGLELSIREHRPTATSGIHAVSVERPIVELDFPHEMQRVETALVSTSRGVLYANSPHSFTRQIAFDLAMISAERDVEVPGTRRRKVERYKVGVTDSSERTLVAPTQRPRRAIRRLLEGYYDRKRKDLASELGQTWFDSDVETATARIRDLVQRASREVFIVDGYFTATELRRFALASGDARVPIRILTSAEGLREIARIEGEEFESRQSRATQLGQDLDLALKQSHANPMELRLMPGRPEIHDRFMLVDGELWMLGASLNELGSRGTVLIRLPDPSSIRRKLEVTWSRAQALATWLRERPA